MIDTGDRIHTERAEVDASKIVIALSRGGMLGGSAELASDSRAGGIDVEDEVPLLAD